MKVNFQSERGEEFTTNKQIAYIKSCKEQSMQNADHCSNTSLITPTTNS